MPKHLTLKEFMEFLESITQDDEPFKLPECKTCGNVSLFQGYCNICGRIASTYEGVKVRIAGPENRGGHLYCGAESIHKLLPHIKVANPIPRSDLYKPPTYPIEPLKLECTVYWLHQMVISWGLVDWVYYIYSPVMTYSNDDAWVDLPLFDTHCERFYYPERQYRDC